MSRSSLARFAVVLTLGATILQGPNATSPSLRTPLITTELHAQEAATHRVHLPMVARNADLSIDPSPPWQPDADFVLGGPAWAVDIVDDVAFVGVGAHLLAYDISGDDSMPLLGASPPLTGNVRDVVVRDGYAFAAVSQMQAVTEHRGGLFVLDVRDPASIEVVAVRQLEKGATRIDLDGDRALLVDFDVFSNSSKYLTVFDISDPRAPYGIRQGGQLRPDAGDVVLHDETVYVCVGPLLMLDLGRATEPWILDDVLGRCARLAQLEPEGLLISVSDTSVLGVDSPAVQIFGTDDPFRPTLISETPLPAPPDITSWYKVSDVQAVGSTVYITGATDYVPGSSGSGGVLIELDVSDPISPIVVSARFDLAAGLAVDGDGGRVVIAGAHDGPDLTRSMSERFIEDRPHTLGSRIMYLTRDADGVFQPVETLDGPGTMLSTVECVGDTAYVFDMSSDLNYSTQRLWALDIGSDYPRTISAVESSPRLGILHEGPSSVAVSESGLFVEIGGAVSQYQMVDGRLERIGSVSDDGSIEVSGHHLFVATIEAALNVYDVAEPGEWPLIASIDLADEGRRFYSDFKMAERDGVLWVAATYGRPFESSIKLVDVSDPSAPVLDGELRIEEAFDAPKILKLAASDDSMWLLSSETEREPAHVAVRRLVASEETAEPQVIDHWASDLAPNSTVFPFAFAVRDGWGWFMSLRSDLEAGELFAMDSTADAGLRLAGVRDRPAAVSSRIGDFLTDARRISGGLSVAACGDRIFGTDFEGGMYGIDPERWLEGADENDR